jgi:hypothetical protein
LFVHPSEKRLVYLGFGLIGLARDRRTTAPLQQQVPHGGFGLLTAAFVRRFSLIRHKVKGAALYGKVPLLGLERGQPDLRLES